MTDLRLVVEWSIDEQGFLIAPSGSSVARLSPHGIHLYDKRTRSDWRLSVEQLRMLLEKIQEEKN